MDLFNKLAAEREYEKEVLEQTTKGKSRPVSDMTANSSVLTGAVPPPTKTSNYLQEATGWIYACIAVIADEIASANIKLFKTMGSQTKEVINHPVIDLLSKPNDFTTRYDMFWLMAQYLELTGEAPLYISYNGKTPKALLLLEPDKFYVKPGTGENIIGGYEYQTGAGQRIQLEPQEIMFLRFPDLVNPFRGRGTLRAAATSGDIERYSEEFNKKFYFNSARPDAVLSTEGKLTQPIIDRLEKKIKEKYAGLENAHKTMILEGGMKFTPMNLSQKDMDFVEQQRFSRDKILGIFRVPRTVLGITDDVNRANAEATDFVFAKRTIRPKLIRLMEQLNEFLLPKFPGTERMFLWFDDVVPQDTASLATRSASALQAGYMTINEVRDLNNLDSIGEEGDVLRIPFGNKPIDAADEPAPEEPAADPNADPNAEEPTPPEEGKMYKEIVVDTRRKKGKHSNAIKAAVSRSKEKEEKDKLVQEVQSKLTKIVKGIILEKKGIKKKVKKVVKKKEVEPEPIVADEPKQPEMDADTRASNFQATQLRVGEEYEGRIKGRLDKRFGEQKNEVLKKLGTKAKAQKALNADDFLLDPKKEATKYKKVLKPLIAQILVEQSDDAFGFIGMDDELDLEVPQVNEFLNGRIFNLSFAVTEETNSLLGDTLREGIQKGEGIPDLSKRVSELFDGMEKYRSERIARTETIQATNFATEQAWLQSDVVVEKEWFTYFDDVTDPDCIEMSGKRVKIGEEFGDGLDHPPLHPNCRCTLLPVIGKAFNNAQEREKLADIEKQIEQLQADEKEN